MSEQTALQAFDSGGVAEFGTFRNPEVALKEAELVAVAFRKRAEALQLYKKIGESKHLLIEGWQMLASMYRVTASISGTRFVQYGDVQGFEATADAIHVPTGQKISSADAQCLNDEERWSVRPKYEFVDGKRKHVGDVPVPMQQLRSMSQTRACSKVLSNLLKFVARMAGFAGTPAEEMTGHEEPGEGAAPSVAMPQRKGAAISEAQAKRFYALTKAKGMDDAAIKEYVRSWGFEKSTDITRDVYEAMCALQPPKPAQSDGLKSVTKADLDRIAAENKERAANAKTYANFESAPDPLEADGAWIYVGGKLHMPNADKSAWIEVKS